MIEIPNNINPLWHKAEDSVRQQLPTTGKTIFGNRHVVITRTKNGDVKSFVTGTRLLAFAYFIKAYLSNEDTQWKSGKTFEDIKGRFSLPTEEEPIEYAELEDNPLFGRSDLQEPLDVKEKEAKSKNED